MPLSRLRGVRHMSRDKIGYPLKGPSRYLALLGPRLTSSSLVVLIGAQEGRRANACLTLDPRPSRFLLPPGMGSFFTGDFPTPRILFCHAPALLSRYFRGIFRHSAGGHRENAHIRRVIFYHNLRAPALFSCREYAILIPDISTYSAEPTFRRSFGR